MESEGISSSAQFGVALWDNLISNAYVFAVVKNALKEWGTGKEEIQGFSLKQQELGVAEGTDDQMRLPPAFAAGFRVNPPISFPLHTDFFLPT